MLSTVRHTIEARDLIVRNQCVLAACSGGPDSVAMTAALRELAAVIGFELCVGHVDHGLRPGSERDGEHVRAVCSRLGLSARVERIDVPPGRGGLQERARNARYACLERVASELGCARIAVAHTLSDQAETVVHRILRGAGLEGLGGIPYQRGRVVRPLLDVSRAEVLGYLETRSLEFVQDPSNELPEFLRVRIRRDVVPLLENLVPGIERRLSALAVDAREAVDELQRQAARFSAPSVAAVLLAPRALRPWALREVLRQLRGDLRGLTRLHIQAALGLLEGAGDGEVHLAGGSLVRDGDDFRWEQRGKRGRSS